MAILRITAAEVASIARLDLTDTEVVADIAAALAGEQSALEQTLDPAAFALPGAADLLRRNVAKLLAAEVLATRGRAPGARGDLQLGTGVGEIKIGHVPDAAIELRAEANAALAPYLLRQAPMGHALTSAGAAASLPAASDRCIQDRLYGPSEADRTQRGFADNERRF